MEDLNPIDKYCIEHHTQQLQNTFFSSLCGTFTKIDHMLGPRASLNRFQRAEIAHRVCSVTTVQLNKKLITER